ncbi:hypothetical protein SAMN04488523_1062 [Sulfitobacter brevis]|uniref:Trypsin-co-occurring domain-containing protein n=1 Tax=Sulfitobacter brevis TaxID=74348 RepID=A0A1I1YZ80_9RHOB|nr:trypco2 family protein [Sulfitobacter brevis]SFE24779.1 hypothetical protein SAMN04488523_1062 [Sulfitobacter brevis]
MDLKDFIKETMTGIIEATNELQDQWSDEGVYVNPPMSKSSSEVYEENSSDHIFRQIQTVKFDVAVTAASETSGGGKAGLKVFSAEIGAKGEHSRQSEEVSRVQFTIPLTLRASLAESRNIEQKEKEKRESQERTRRANQGRQGGRQVT